MLALKYYRRAIEIDVNNPMAYHNRAYANSRLGNYQSALIDYTAAIKLSDSVEAYINRGALQMKLGNITGAIEDYSASINLNPNCWQAYFNRVLAYQKLGNKTHAIRDLTIARKLK